MSDSIDSFQHNGIVNMWEKIIDQSLPWKKTVIAINWFLTMEDTAHIYSELYSDGHLIKIFYWPSRLKQIASAHLRQCFFTHKRI